MLTVTVTRNNGWYGRLRTARIMADGEEVGRIKSNESIDILIPPHANNLYAKMDWGKSAPYPISNLTHGQTLFMNAWFTFNLFRSLGIAPIPITFEEEPYQEKSVWF